ncbi:hypothetical protein A4X06_0g9614, partial [Tilletia controversa]
QHSGTLYRPRAGQSAFKHQGS